MRRYFGVIFGAIGNPAQGPAPTPYNVNFGSVPAAAANVTLVDETTLHVLVPAPAAAADSPQAVIVTVAETKTPATPLSGTHAQAVFIYDV